MTKDWLSMFRSTRFHHTAGDRRVRLSQMIRFALALVTSTFVLTTGAQAWWNEDWSMRKQIAIDTSSTGADITDAIGTTPLLVRLHVGNFRFASAKPDGSDLRFVAGDDKTPLKHHVEKYESLLGEALVWVNVPNVQPGAKASVWLYYGNQNAPAANDSKGTYDPDTLLVYHFTERGVPALDSSAWASNAQSAGQPADGAIIGTGLRLDGRVPLTLPASPSLTMAENGALTWATWIKPATLQRNAVIYSRRDGRNALVIGLDDGAPFVEVTSNDNVQRTAAAAPVAPGGWHHIAMVATPGLITLYLDGNPYATLSSSLPALNSIALLGGDSVAAAPPSVAPAIPAPVTAPAGNPGDPAAPAPVDPAAPATVDPAAPVAADPAANPVAPVVAAPAPVASAMPGFAGDIDELTIAKIARSAGFIKIAAVGQGPDPSKLILFSVDEETSSWLSGYFGVLLKAVTFDGWVIIGILLVMALASWVVMVEKHGYLKRQRNANNTFLPAFRRLQHDLTLLSDADGDAMGADTSVTTQQGEKAQKKARQSVQRNSSLNRIYQIGADEIRRRFPDDATGGSHVLSAEAIAAIRAALDAGLVREIQALNRLMVILTISISGGPFLGLLGTVMGVMITFAAIAMSGDVNINAIAPGVAGALMATVAGLAVAIPALFGYNWLTLRIRDLISDLQVFVDEFTTKMAEIYSTQRPGPVVHRMAAE
jgi:biopolymer transport protein ExbB